MKIASTINQLILNQKINATNADRCGVSIFKNKNKLPSFQDQILALDRNKTMRCEKPTVKDKNKISSIQDQAPANNRNIATVNLFSIKKIN